MWKFLEFLVCRMSSPGALIWGIVDVVTLPDGKKVIVREIQMGDTFETEFDYLNGTVVRIRGGRVRVLKDALE